MGLWGIAGGSSLLAIVEALQRLGILKIGG
jgi:hypothetical protein